MEYGILCLVPPTIIIIVAIVSKSTILALLLGVISACVIQDGWGFIDNFVDLVYSVGADTDTIWYVFFVVLFACMLGMWLASGSISSFASTLERYATTKKRTLLLTWFLGIILFIDDFTSVAVRGTLTDLFDKHKIPRAMLTYIADSTASPICILVPFGTWAIFYQSVFSGYEDIASMGSIMETYIKMIPTLFYGWAALIIPLFASIGIIKPMGAMKRAWIRAEETGELYSEDSVKLNLISVKQEKQSADVEKLLGFIIPLIIFIVIVFKKSDVIVAAIISIIVMVAYYLITRQMKVSEIVTASVEGIKDMADMILIVIFAYMLRDSLVAMDMPNFVISTVAPNVSPELLPFISFTVCSFITFASGSTWGTTVAASAILVPLCTAVSGNMIYVMSAIVSGAAFGSHACFYCDVTVLTSAMTKIDNMEHALTQLPYAAIGLVISCVGYLAIGCF